MRIIINVKKIFFDSAQTLIDEDKEKTNQVRLLLSMLINLLSPTANFSSKI